MQSPTEMINADEGVKKHIQSLIEFIEMIFEILKSLKDEELIAIRKDLFSSPMVTSDSAHYKRDLMLGIIGREMRDRWEKERDHLMQSSPLYRFHHDRNGNLPF